MLMLFIIEIWIKKSVKPILGKKTYNTFFLKLIVKRN